MESKELEIKNLEVINKSQLIMINGNESLKTACDLLLVIKDLRSEISQTFDPIIMKAHEAHKEAIGQKKRVETPLIEAENVLKPKIAQYQLQEENKIKALEKKAEAEMKAILKKDPEAEILPAVIPISTPRMTGVSTRTVFKFTITSPDLIPAKFKIIDEQAIAAVVRSLGDRARIPGVKVYSEKVVYAGRK